MDNLISRYATYQQLKCLAAKPVKSKNGLSLEQYEDIIHSIEASLILKIALANYPIPNLSKLLEKARSQYQVQQNQTQKQAINVHDAVFAAKRAKTKKWLKDHQPRELVFNDDDVYKKQLLGILANNKDWLNNLSAKDKEGPNHEENGIVADFPEYIEAIFGKYKEGSTGKDTLFWLLENISKLEGESKQDAEIYLLTTLNMARLAYGSPGNVFRGKRYSCMTGLDDRLIDMVFTYIPEETKRAQEAFIETYYRIAVKSILHLLPKMFIDAHNEMFKSDTQYSEAYDACEGITHDEKMVIKPLKNKVCEMFGINNFYLEHLLSVSDDNELYGMFSYIDLVNTNEHTEEKQKQIAEINKIDAKSRIAEKLEELKILQKNNYYSENLQNKHMTYFVWDQDIEEKLVQNIIKNIDDHLDVIVLFDIPCQEELIITLVNKDRFERIILKKLFLASVKSGFSNLAEKILDKLTVQNQPLNGGRCVIVDPSWYFVEYALNYKNYAILGKLFNKGISVNIKDEYGNTALYIAYSMGDEKAIEVLLEHGADVDEKDKHGYTTLHKAVRCGCKRTVAVLLKHGPNVEARDKSGNTALVIASKRGYTDLLSMLLDYKTRVYQDSVLHHAAYLGNIGKINILLNECNINAKNINGDTPLHYAAMNGHLQAAIALLREGADILITNNKGYSIVFTSLINGHIWMCFIMFLYHIRAMFTPLNNAKIPTNNTESEVLEPIDLENNNLGKDMDADLEQSTLRKPK